MTAPEHGGVPETRVADFAAFVRPKEGEDPPIIVGGHAVNLWSEYFLARDVKELLGYVGEGRASDRALINVLEETLAISTSRQAIKASELWGFDFTALWPVDGLKSLGEGKVSRWLQHRFPQNPS